MTKATVSPHTRNNWLIDVAVAFGALIAAIVYFLFLPSGGYQGGRNPWYGVTILFERHTWGDLHTWFGALMVAAVAVHFTLHWPWVQSMTRRMARAVYWPRRKPQSARLLQRRCARGDRRELPARRVLRHLLHVCAGRARTRAPPSCSRGSSGT